MFAPNATEFGAAGTAPTAMDSAMLAAQLQAARQQNESELIGKRARADRIALEQPWKNPNFPAITVDNVIFYFCQEENPFYDSKNSDNAMLIMQNPGIGLMQLNSTLKNMTGIQFVLVEPCSPPLFIIRKQQRNGPDKITPLCHFYVLDGTVYQAPDMHTLVHSRLVSMMDPLRCAFSEAMELLRFQPARGHFWEFRTRPARLAADEEADREAAEDGAIDGICVSSAAEARGDCIVDDPRAVRATPYQSQRTHALLAALAERFGSGGNKQQTQSASAAAEKMEIDLASSSTAENDAQQHSAAGAGPPSSSSTVVAAPSTLSSVLTNYQGLLFASTQQQQQQPNPRQPADGPSLSTESAAGGTVRGVPPPPQMMHNGHQQQSNGRGNENDAHQQ